MNMHLCCSLAWSGLTFCHPMDYHMPGIPIHYNLPVFAQPHVHWFSDFIQPSHPLSSPSPPALYLSQHQSLFQWVVSSHQVAKVLELEHQSFQWMFRVGKWGPWEIIRVEPSQMRWVRLKEEDMDFPGGTVVKTLPSNAGGVGLIHDQGAKVLHPSRTTTTNNRENRT